MENQPEKKFRAGAVSATIWKNIGQSKTGAPTEFKTISLQRSYKDKEGKWQNTSTLRLNDLPRAQLVLNKAYEFLCMSGSNDNDSVSNKVSENIVM